MSNRRGLPQEEVPYQAFSGANMHVTVGPRRVGSLQGITVSITREVAALYGFGDANPKAFVKGKRGIAGSMVFSTFDRHALLRGVFREGYNARLGDNALNEKLYRSIPGSPHNPVGGAAIPTRTFGSPDQVAGAGNAAFGGGTDQELIDEFADVYQMVLNQRQRYSDQIPEFDVTITMVNDSGAAASCVIGGIVLINEGWGYTLDDLTSESAFTFVAKYVTPLTSLTDVAEPGRARFAGP